MIVDHTRTTSPGERARKAREHERELDRALAARHTRNTAPSPSLTVRGIPAVTATTVMVSERWKPSQKPRARTYRKRVTQTTTTPTPSNNNNARNITAAEKFALLTAAGIIGNNE